jgi:hypothetical protein
VLFALLGQAHIHQIVCTYHTLRYFTLSIYRNMTDVVGYIWLPSFLERRGTFLLRPLRYTAKSSLKCGGI